MLKGKSYDPLASDIWSCGVLLYGMVAGYMPFDDESTAKIFENIQNGNYEMPEDTSAECNDLIQRILDTNVATRLTIFEIRKHILIRDDKKEVAICVEEL